MKKITKVKSFFLPFIIPLISSILLIVLFSSGSNNFLEMFFNISSVIFIALVIILFAFFCVFFLRHKKYIHLVLFILGFIISLLTSIFAFIVIFGFFIAGGATG